MLEGLVWLIASVASAVVLIHTIPKTVVATTIAYRKRNVEPATKDLPSAVCPTCAGSWGGWSKIHEDVRPNNPNYPSISGHHIVRSQTRQCNDCGYGERRVL